ncbi:hypothetical protein EC973_007333, partial [Apophysomyces ossiformis]
MPPINYFELHHIPHFFFRYFYVTQRSTKHIIDNNNNNTKETLQTNASISESTASNITNSESIISLAPGQKRKLENNKTNKTSLSDLIPDRTHLNVQISSLKEIIQQLKDDKQQMMAQQSQLMQLIMTLQAKLAGGEACPAALATNKNTAKKPASVPSSVPVMAPSSRPSSSAASLIHASSKPISYAKVAAKHVPAKPKKKKPISINTVQKILSVSTGPSTYNFVYLPCRHHVKHSDVCRLLGSLKIIQSKILDVQFPARSVVALLVHQAYYQELVDSLTKAGVKPLDDFNPTSPIVIGDPKYATLSSQDKSHMAKNLLISRLLCTCLHLPVHLGNSVAQYFA